MAFYKCFSLEEVILGKSLEKLGSNVFTASSVKVATIQSDIRDCGTDVFSECENLTHLNFGETVKCIGNKFAFGCTHLKYVSVKSFLEYIGKNAFYNTIYLEEINGNIISDKIFLDGTMLVGDIIIPDGIISIAGGAFYGNTQITSITLPSSLIRIGERCFCGCTSLKKIIIPELVKVLEEGVFSYCTSLETVIFEGEINRILDNVFYGCVSLYQIPNLEIAYIGKNAFNGCENLKNINLLCTDIGEDAFRNTKFLLDMKKVSELVIVSKIIIYGKETLGDVIIPEGATSIAPFAFAGNLNITSITLPNTLKTIGYSAFYGCKNLKHIYFEHTLKSIGKKSFEKCISLTELVGNIESIQDAAYSYCINLKNVDIGEKAFKNCISLKNKEEYLGIKHYEI